MNGGSAGDARGPDHWARAFTDPQLFWREQAALGRRWTFLGWTRDVPNDGDWFRTTLATRSVFVQRFGDTLKGFENVCAHRFYPLRTADAGHGPIVCGFHHWRYDKEGRALGIPMCQELFGVTPRELDARLKPVEIASCGEFIFGRFAAPGDGETLEQSLGEGFAILQAMSQAPEPPQSITRTVKANWKLCYHASLDDYHLVAVHPDTFGRIGYLKRENIGYHRFGRNSAYFTNADPDALRKMAAACRDGTWRSANYRTFQIFPNFAVAHFQAYAQFWYILTMQFQPLAVDRTLMRAWIHRAPFPAEHSWINARTRGLTEPFRRLLVRHFSQKVMAEDNAVCERLQTVAHQARGRPLIGALEERVAWFEEVYAQALSEPAPENGR